MTISENGSTVSVIVPTYNSLELLSNCLDSVERQTIEADRVECLVVDDGSTDETWAYLQQRRSNWPNLRIFWQENTGGPSVGRNLAISEAGGRYVYFLDADDWLGDDALRRLLKAADSYGSDVVLGRGKGVGTKGVNKVTFARTVPDADMLDDHAWRILAPWKLFRRSLLLDHELRFPEDQVQGEDQVFVASCYFSARKISILTDYDFHYVHGRTTGGNLSRQSQSLENKLLTTTRMAKLIVDHTEPGPRRDAFLGRIVLRTLTPSFGAKFAQASAAEQERFLTTVRNEVLAYVSDDLLAGAADVTRIRLLTAQRGTVDDVVALHRTLRSGTPVRIDEGRLQIDLPPRLTMLLDGQLELHEPLSLRQHKVIRVVRTEEGVSLTIRLRMPRVDPAVDRVDLITEPRSGKALVIKGESLGPNKFRFDLRPDQLRPGEAQRTLICRFRLEVAAGRVVVGQSPLFWQPHRQIPAGRQHFDWVSLNETGKQHLNVYRSSTGLVGLRIARTRHPQSIMIKVNAWPRVRLIWPPQHRTSPASPDTVPVRLRVLTPDGESVASVPRPQHLGSGPLTVDLAPHLPHAVPWPLVIQATTDTMLCQRLVRHEPQQQTRRTRPELSGRLSRLARRALATPVVQRLRRRLVHRSG